MCKGSYIKLIKNRKIYRLYSTDIQNIHKHIQKSRPALPKYKEKSY